MSMRSRHSIIYVHDLPFQPRKSLCDILDADRSWEKLGGLMHYDVTTLTLIGHAVYRDRSPTWELLNKFSEKNGTIKALYVALYQMDHQRAMFILKPYVEEKYHNLLRNESTYSTFEFRCSKKEDIPMPAFSQLLSKQNIYQMLQTSKNQISGACATQFSQEKSIVNSDLANFNQKFSSLSLHSKKKVLNVTQEESNCPKKLPAACSKKNYSKSKEESISDNCISEKIRNIKKSSGVMLKQEKNKNNLPQFQYAVNLPSQDDCLPDFMRIPYKDIVIATDDFNKDRVLGRGGFGTVYRGEWKGTSVAIKRLTPRQSSQDPSQQLVSLKQSLNELNVLKCCRFDHILPLYAVSLDGENPCLIYQLMVNGSLEDWLFLKNKTPALTWSQRSHIAECTTKGLNYLHTTPEKPLVHGDIKSANILLDGNMEAKIGDFGLTREGPGCEDTHVKVTSIHGTECYLPDEYLRNRHLSPQVDVYSYGIVLLEMATGLRPLDVKRGEGKRLAKHVAMCDTSGHLESLRDIKAGEENMLWFRELLQIGQKCSNNDKKKRPSMQEVLERFEKIKEEMFTHDKIRRLSNDKGTSLKSLKMADANVSPMALQKYYDNQKNKGCQQVESPNRIESLPDVLNVEQKQDLYTNSHKFEKMAEKANESSSQSVEDLSDDMIREFNLANNHQQTSLASYGEKSVISNPAPLPLLTVLQLQVSECNETSEEIETPSEDITSDNCYSLS